MALTMSAPRAEAASGLPRAVEGRTARKWAILFVGCQSVARSRARRASASCAWALRAFGSSCALRHCASSAGAASSRAAHTAAAKPIGSIRVGAPSGSVRNLRAAGIRAWSLVARRLSPDKTTLPMATSLCARISGPASLIKSRSAG